MRAEPRHRSVRPGLAALAVLLVAAPSLAEPIYGTLQLQYQKAEDEVRLLGGDGRLRTQHLSRELWLRTLDLHHQDYLRPNLLLESNFRLSDQSFLDRGDLTRTPQGGLRLIHPWFQVVASHQPTTVKASLTSQTGLNPDSATTRHVTTRNTESLVTGHFSAPNLPRLDVAWIRRRRDGAGSAGDRSVNRNARLTFDRDNLSMYGSVSDDTRNPASPGAGENRQQVLAGGGSLRLAPVRNTSLTMQYDLTGVSGSAAGLRRPSTTSQSGLVSGDWRPEKRITGTMNYQWRHIDFGTLTNPAQTDHDAGLMFRFVPSRVANLVTGTGLRTVRNPGASGVTSEALQKYAMAILSLDARVRRAWSATASAAHTTSWDPVLGRFGVQTVSGSSRAQLSPRIQVDGSVQVTANGDSAASSQRISNSWTTRVQGTPLRTLTLSVSMRSLRVGRGLLNPSGVSRGRVVDATWRPVRALQMIGTYGSTGAMPNDGNRSATRSVSARLDASRRWQWWGSWTRADQTVISSTSGQLSRREVVSTRLQYEPTRRLAASAGVTYNEPGRDDQSHQLDLAFTWSFGR